MLKTRVFEPKTNIFIIYTQSHIFAFQNRIELVLDCFQDRFRMGLDAILTPKGGIGVVLE